MISKLEWTKRHPFSDEIGDGFDPAIPYQMIPVGGTRPMGLRTGMYPVELTVGIDVSCGMENFHAVDPMGMHLPDVPPGTTKSAKLPPNTAVYFDLRGGGAHSSGKLRVHEIVDGRTLSYASLDMLISVMQEKTASFTPCYVFDEINPDDGSRAPYDAALQSADKIFFTQANVHIRRPAGAKILNVPGSLGAAFDPIDDVRVRRVLTQAVDELGAGVFRENTSAVIFHLPMIILGWGPRNAQKQFISRERPLAVTVHYVLDGKPCDVIWVSAAYPETDSQLAHTLPHEIGHFLGLEHLPQEETDVFPKGMPDGPKNAKYKEPWLHNLMFPTNFVLSKRMNGSQVERAHLGRPDRYRFPV